MSDKLKIVNCYVPCVSFSIRTLFSIVKEYRKLKDDTRKSLRILGIYFSFIFELFSFKHCKFLCGTPSKFVETFEEQGWNKISKDRSRVKTPCTLGTKWSRKGAEWNSRLSPVEASVKDGKTKFSQGGCLMMRGKSCVTFTLDNFHLIEPAYHSNGTVSLTRR